MIDVRDLTLTYPSGKGVFGLNFTAGKGEVLGCLGPNGAGKTTTIRALLGFMRPNRGSCEIGGLDCARRTPEIMKTLGYIPGEISFPSGMCGGEFLRLMRGMRGSGDDALQKRLIDMFELNIKGNIKKFSKGMKQKLGIIAAFMHDPEVLILDEPTSGLDPLMQNRFVNLILEEKKRGKTILMSSHIFEEIEKTCDSVIIIKDGRIIKKSDVAMLKTEQRKCFVIRCENNSAALEALLSAGFHAETAPEGIELYCASGETSRLINALSALSVLELEIKAQTLEDIFMQYYGKEEK